MPLIPPSWSTSFSGPGLFARFRSSQTKERFQTFKNQNDDTYQSTTLCGSQIRPSCTHSLTESNSFRFPEISNAKPVWTVRSYTYSTCSFSSLGTKNTFRWLISTWDHYIWLFSYCNNGFSTLSRLAANKAWNSQYSRPNTSWNLLAYKDVCIRTTMGSLLSRRYHSSFCEALGLPLPGSYRNWNRQNS